MFVCISTSPIRVELLLVSVPTKLNLWVTEAQLPWLFYLHQNFVHISSSVSVSWVKIMTWCPRSYGKEFQIWQTAPSLTSPFKQRWSLPSLTDNNSERLGTLSWVKMSLWSILPIRVHGHCSYLLLAVVLSLALQRQLEPCFMNWFTRAGRSGSHHHQVGVKYRDKNTGACGLGRALVNIPALLFINPLGNFPPILLFSQLQNGHSNT